MRSSLMVLASLLLLLVLATTAHGIRLDKDLHEAPNNKEQLAGQPTKPNGAADSAGSSKQCTPDGDCSGTTTMEQTAHTTAAVVAKDREHQVVASAYARPAVPRFHEDYYGPGGHEPNHH